MVQPTLHTRLRFFQFKMYHLHTNSTVLHGRWGVVPASQHQEILVALASLIRAQRYDMALTILDNELGGGC
jgi:hypothetical protein